MSEKTHCPIGHPYSGDNRLIDSRGHKACRICRTAAQMRYRKIHPQKATPGRRSYDREQRRRGDVYSGYSKNVINLIGKEAISAALEEVRATGLVKSGAAFVGKWRWKSLLFHHKSIHNRVRKLITINPYDRGAHMRAPAIIRSPDMLMDIIEHAVPAHLPRDLRDDAVQNIWMAVLEKRLKPDEIAARARDFVSAEYKNSHNAWGPISLDAHLTADSDATLLDRLSTDASTGFWDFNMLASTGRRK